MELRRLWIGSILVALAALPSGCRPVQGLWHEQEIRDGQLKELVIGSSIADAIGGLRRMNVGMIYLDSTTFATVTRAEDLHRVSGAGKISVEGGASVLFDDDQVAEVHVPPAPHFARWRELLEPARTRAEALESIRRILTESPGVKVREVTPGTNRVLLASVGPQELALLTQHDLWHVTFSDRLGFWGARLYFAQGILRRIVYSFSPVEL